MMCIKCQKWLLKLSKGKPNAKVKVSWPEGVAVSSFDDKANYQKMNTKIQFWNWF